MLQVELISPLDNLVGFEHAPADAAQRAALAAAESRLQDAASRMFALPAEAGCTVRQVEIESPWPQGERKHDHAHAHDHAQPTRANAEDMVVSYGFECAHPRRCAGWNCVPRSTSRACTGSALVRRPRGQGGCSPPGAAARAL